MSASVKLSSALPGDIDTNGVDDLAADLVDDPSTIRAAIILYDVSKIVDNTDDGTRIPYLRVRRIESLGVAAEVESTISDLVQKITEQRTGRKPLPFESPEPYEVEAE